MQQFELRIYNLRSKEAVNFYKDVVYPRHLKNFHLFGVTAQGLSPPQVTEGGN